MSTASKTPATSPVARLYDNDGLARKGKVPANHPILSGGSADPTVPRLVAVLNDQLGAELPVGETVTPEVLAAVNALRAKLEIPPEQGVVGDPAGYIGPNVWAAVEALA